MSFFEHKERPSSNTRNVLLPMQGNFLRCFACYHSDNVTHEALPYEKRWVGHPFSTWEPLITAGFPELAFMSDRRKLRPIRNMRPSKITACQRVPNESHYPLTLKFCAGPLHRKANLTPCCRHIVILSYRHIIISSFHHIIILCHEVRLFHNVIFSMII